MEDKEVLLQLIEDYPNLINSLESVTNLSNWSKDLRNAIGSIYSGNKLYFDVTENLKFLILYLLDREGFFIYIHELKLREKFFIQLGYIKEGLESLEDATTVFYWYSSFHDNEQVLREKLLKNIMRDFSPSIPKEKEMLQEVIYSCKVISSEEKKWNLGW